MWNFSKDVIRGGCGMGIGNDPPERGGRGTPWAWGWAHFLRLMTFPDGSFLPLNSRIALPACGEE